MPEIRLNNMTVAEQLPLIALKNTVLFPKLVIPLMVQRSKSVAALEAAMSRDRLVLFTTQRNLEDDVNEEDLFQTGSIGRVISAFKLPDGSWKIDVEGVARARISAFMTHEPFFEVRYEPILPESTGSSAADEALVRRVLEQFQTVAKARSFPQVVPEVLYVMSQLKDAEQIIGLVTANLNLEVSEQQKILEMRNHADALRQLNAYLTREMDVLKAEKDLAQKTKKQIGRMQKEMFLREQLKSIERELGVDDEREELDVLRKKIEKAKMPEAVLTKATKELSRLAKMPPMSPETSYIRTYLDWLVELPWHEKTNDKIDLKAAQRVLDQDHYGLPKVKERILEYLAVQKQVGKLKGPILCLFGPPGTGKTSIGQSVARALDRKFVRVSLGGMRDEAEIRGHRRTYVGALPGRIIQGMHQAKVKNPVFMLDEIDKLGMDFRGDPSAALLEALDPEQNNAFSDHYLEVPFDLSDVLFIATANSLETIPPALRDRLEIIDFPGYTAREKLSIAKRFLMPKTLRDHGLKKTNIKASDAVLTTVIDEYTREAGVRELQRQLASIVRKVTRANVESGTTRTVSLTVRDVRKHLGAARYSHEDKHKTDEVGVATGLAWTPVGGEILTIEVTRMPGKGRLTLTGQLGDVMRESAQAALSYARTYVAKYGIKNDLLKDDLHIHVPSGAVRKDGPSAGIAMTTALVSLFTGRPVRKDVAMTGEITLRGKVTEIGGLKEKSLAALRAGIKTVVIPESNKKDLAELPKEVASRLKFQPVRGMHDVIEHALLPPRMERSRK
ncbi:MAG TPA: endopeptidase La [Candidatus Paceibacterota bacterium]|nr:endopeptidase La [Candidatus Paceibacterota bacterium]